MAFGALAAGSMFAAAAGSALSPRIEERRAGLRPGYLLALGVAALSVTVLGAPGTVALFVFVYLLAYLSLGLIDPMHMELLNDAVGPTARATLISAESLATQGGALVANLAVGALASTHGAASGRSPGRSSPSRRSPWRCRSTGRRAPPRPDRRPSTSPSVPTPTRARRGGATPPRTEANLRRGQPMASSMSGNVRGVSAPPRAPRAARASDRCSDRETGRSRRRPAFPGSAAYAAVGAARGVVARPLDDLSLPETTSPSSVSSTGTQFWPVEIADLRGASG